MKRNDLNVSAMERNSFLNIFDENYEFSASY